MEVIDTVLSAQERIDLWRQYKKNHPDTQLVQESDYGYVKRLLTVQVEKTWPIAFEVGHKAGMKEVVEWLFDHSTAREAIFIPKII